MSALNGNKIFKRLFPIVITLLSPFLSFTQQVLIPVPSFAPGYYSDSILLNLTCGTTGAQIYFTTNGSEPTQSSTLFTAAFIVRDRSQQVNSVSMIPTNPSFNYPQPGFDSSRANDRGWLPPYDTVNKCTIVKAKAFKNGFPDSKTMCATYFIGPQLNNRYPFPVISVIADSMDLFSDTLGAFVYGLDTANGGNYYNPGFMKKVHVEFFDAEGNRVVSQYCDMRIHGNGGRENPQKSLWLTARESYGPRDFNYSFFYPSQLNLREILIRNGGHRPDCFPRDNIAGEIASGLHFEIQSQQHYIVFVNGEYWGLQTGKNLMNLKFLESKYNISEFQAAVISGGGVFDDGVPGDQQVYLNFINFIQNNNIALAQNYNYVNSQIDVESFTDFQCAEIYLGNGDWPDNNTKLWRYKKGYNPNATNALDGRWHWMMYDLDACFGGDCSNITPLFNTLNNAFNPSYGTATVILRTLVNNPTYKKYFINRFADLLNTTFNETRVQGIMSNYDDQVSPLMLEHVERWRYPAVATTLLARSTEIPSLTKWNTINSGLYSFGGLRPNKVRKHIMNHFLLADTIHLTLNVSDTAQGKIKMNTIYIDKFTQGIYEPVYPWTGTYFDGNDVTIEAIPKFGFKFLHWNDITKTQNPLTINIASDSLVTAVFGPDTSFRALHYLYINELMARNSSAYKDDFNEFDDWIEIYNPNNFPVDIAGCYVSDRASNKKKYRLGEGDRNTIIPAKGFILIWADSTIEQGVIHSNFQLSGNGEGIYFTSHDGQTTIDSVIFPSQLQNRSWGRAKDGDSTWIIWEKPTPKTTNVLQPLIFNPASFLYPNPAVDSQFIYFAESVDAMIYDVLGNKIVDLYQAVNFDISLLAKGVYFLKIMNGETIKFVKI